MICSCAEGEETRDAVLVTDGDSEMGQVLFQHCSFFLMYITYLSFIFHVAIENLIEST